MVILLALTAAVLYGSGDFLGGMASRRAPVLSVLLVVDLAGVIVALGAAGAWPAPVTLAGLGWGAGAGLAGGTGLIVFYTGLATGPMSVVAPVSGLMSTVLPVAVALAEGERPSAGVYLGAALCLVAIVLASSAGGGRENTAAGGEENTAAGGKDRTAVDGRTGAGNRQGRRWPGRAIGCGMLAGTSFGLFFLLIRNGGEAGELWPVAAARIGELAIILVALAVAQCGPTRRSRTRRSRPRRSPVTRGAGPRDRAQLGAGGPLLLAAAAGAIDVIANICYVAATRAGWLGLAVVLASLYPGVTVLLARVVLGERLRWVQRAGLGLAAVGVLLVAA